MCESTIFSSLIQSKVKRFPPPHHPQAAVPETFNHPKIPLSIMQKSLTCHSPSIQPAQFFLVRDRCTQRCTEQQDAEQTEKSSRKPNTRTKNDELGGSC